jgi:hypothetical protein
MQKHVINFHSLIAAVIGRAIEDLKGADPRCPKKEPDRAMAFILSETCEAYCLELGIDYEAVREKAAALYRRIIAREAPAAQYPKSRRAGGYQVTSVKPFPKKKRLPLPEAGRR